MHKFFHLNIKSLFSHGILKQNSQHVAFIEKMTHLSLTHLGLLIISLAIVFRRYNFQEKHPQIYFQKPLMLILNLQSRVST